MQIGTGFGLMISAIVFNRVVVRHGCVDKPSLDGYKAAHWTAKFGFAMLGQFQIPEHLMNAITHCLNLQRLF